MGLTRDEAERCGLGHLYPEPASEPGARANPGRRVTGKNVLGQNQTESAFDRHLADLKARGQIVAFAFEPLKLRLAGRTWLTIDFVVKRCDGSLAAVDVKGGPWEDDAACKMKVAAEQFGWLCDVYIARKDRTAYAGWAILQVTRSGLGRHPVGHRWLTT